MSGWTDKEKAGNVQRMPKYNTVIKPLFYYRVCLSIINDLATKRSYSNCRSHFTLLASQYFISKQASNSAKHKHGRNSNLVVF
jgi:hypothetical protein